eukprot:7396509-Pyramimonas_sp.AAC.2
MLAVSSLLTTGCNRPIVTARGLYPPSGYPTNRVDRWLARHSTMPKLLLALTRVAWVRMGHAMCPTSQLVASDPFVVMRSFREYVKEQQEQQSAIAKKRKEREQDDSEIK